MKAKSHVTPTQVVDQSYTSDLCLQSFSVFRPLSIVPCLLSAMWCQFFRFLSLVCCPFSVVQCQLSIVYRLSSIICRPFSHSPIFSILLLLQLTISVQRKASLFCDFLVFIKLRYGTSRLRTGTSYIPASVPRTQKEGRGQEPSNSLSRREMIQFIPFGSTVVR